MLLYLNIAINFSLPEGKKKGKLMMMKFEFAQFPKKISSFGIGLKITLKIKVELLG